MYACNRVCCICVLNAGKLSQCVIGMKKRIIRLEPPHIMWHFYRNSYLFITETLKKTLPLTYVVKMSHPFVFMKMKTLKNQWLQGDFPFGIILAQRLSEKTNDLWNIREGQTLSDQGTQSNRVLKRLKPCMCGLSSW